MSFLAMFAMYAAVGICGYLLFGVGSSMLITSDLAAAASGPEIDAALA